MKVGDKVRCSRPRDNLVKGKIYTIVEFCKSSMDGTDYIRVDDIPTLLYASRFKLVEEMPQSPLNQKVDYSSITKEIVGR